MSISTNYQATFWQAFNVAYTYAETINHLHKRCLSSLTANAGFCRAAYDAPGIERTADWPRTDFNVLGMKRPSRATLKISLRKCDSKVNKKKRRITSVSSERVFFEQKIINEHVDICYTLAGACIIISSNDYEFKYSCIIAYKRDENV